MNVLQLAELDRLVDGFSEVARLSNVPVERRDVRTEVLSAPHTPPTRLPTGTKAVYAFALPSRCLKVGKAGPKSQARFTTQHYEPGSCLSNLAKSILRGRMRVRELLPSELREHFDRVSERDVRQWMERRTSRYHVFIPAGTPDVVLALLEVFLQCHLQPLFEGRRPL